jgi:hypothetical protein
VLGPPAHRGIAAGVWYKHLDGGFPVQGRGLGASNRPSQSHLLLVYGIWYWHRHRTSCAIKEARGRNFTPPGTLWVQGGAGLGWVWSGGSNLAPVPLGSVAGDPDRHRGWLLCPSSVPVPAGRGLRPRVFSAHGPVPQLQVHAPAFASFGTAPQDRRKLGSCWLYFFGYIVGYIQNVLGIF